MKIFGIGIDLLNIKRIKKMSKKIIKKFSKRILTKNELINYKLLNKNKIKFLAKIFSSKESASKALGTGIKKGIYWNNFEIYNNKLGKPKIKLFNKALKIFKKIKAKKIHITITHEKKYIQTLTIIQ